MLDIVLRSPVLSLKRVGVVVDVVCGSFTALIHNISLHDARTDGVQDISLGVVELIEASNCGIYPALPGVRNKQTTKRSRLSQREMC